MFRLLFTQTNFFISECIPFVLGHCYGAFNCLVWLFFPLLLLVCCYFIRFDSVHCRIIAVKQWNQSCFVRIQMTVCYAIVGISSLHSRWRNFSADSVECNQISKGFTNSRLAVLQLFWVGKRILFVPARNVCVRVIDAIYRNGQNNGFF